ncbi:MAG: ABC transporter permease [bacterium]|nr:ABC transporter permease [bacterium]MCY3651978.1 ABC transporter permease [bacterium]MDE0644211.1 ABC transporter permease [bacterium]
MTDQNLTHLETWDRRQAEYEESRRVGPIKATLDRMLRNRLLLFGTVLGLIVLGAAFVGPTISGADPNLQNFSATHLPPGSEGNLLGTDHLGRDQAVRVFIGIRVSLMVAAGVTLISLALGLVLGMFAGFLGGWRDRTIRGVVDFVWGFPLILVAVLFAGGLGEGLFPVILAVGLVNTAAIARVVRGEVLSLSEREFVEAARAGGLSTPRIMWRHLFPNILAPALVLASYYVAVAIIAEAALSFIGLGAQPPTPSLGGMVSDGRNFLHINPWASTIPGVTIVLLVLSVSLIGDGLRDVFDPRLRHEAKGVEQE